MNTRLISIISTSFAVFLAVLLLTRGCDKPTTKPDDSEAWRERIETLKMHTNIRDNIIDSLQRVIATLKEEHIISNEKLTKVATVNFKRYKQAVAEVQHLRDSFPQVNTLVLAADSVIASKDSLYNAEVSSRYMAEKLYNSIIAEMGDRNVKQIEISSVLTTRITELESDNDKLLRKLQRKKKGNRLLLGLSVGIGAALGIIVLSN